MEFIDWIQYTGKAVGLIIKGSETGIDKQNIIYGHGRLA